MICDKGCCQVGKILYGPLATDVDIDNLAEDQEQELIQCDAFNEMFEDECAGHAGYALSYYCVHMGHNDCLTQIAKEPHFMYHSDLALYAIEQDQLECLQFILHHLKLDDLHLEPLLNNEVTLGPQCRDFVNQWTKQQQQQQLDK